MKVEFHSGVAEPLAHTCRLLRKAHAAGARVVVLILDIRRDPELHEPLFTGIAGAIEAFNARDDIVLGIATGKSRKGTLYALCVANA